MTSDPGTSAILTPFCKTDGLYFDGSHEPESFKFDFDRDVETYFGSKEGMLNITPSFDSIEDYYNYNLRCSELNKTLSKENRAHADMYTIEIKLDQEDID